MTQPLNYTTKAIADLMDMAKRSPNDVRRRGLLFVAEKLRQAEVFLLPEKGELMDRSKPYPEVAPSLYKPPFPVVALEYPASGDHLPDSIYSATRCSRRIALAWDWDGVTPTGDSRDPECPGEGEAVAMASIIFVDNVQRWIPVFAAVLARYDAGYVEPGNMPLQQALVAEGRITEKQATARKLDTRHVLPLLPDAMAALMIQQGERQTFDLIAADLMDEVNAYRDLCLALACANVSAVRHAQPARLNKSRIRTGRPPLKDFHVLEIAGHGDGNGFGTGDNGVRSHLRRGHIRRLGPDRITWVNATMVRGSRAGFVDKQYSVPGARA